MSDVGTTDVDCLETYWVSSADGHFDGTEGGVHLYVDRGDGAGDGGAVLEFDLNGFVLTFHQKTRERWRLAMLVCCE